MPDSRKRPTVTRQDLARLLVLWGAPKGASFMNRGDDAKTIAYLRELADKLPDERGVAIRKIARRLERMGSETIPAADG